MRTDGFCLLQQEAYAWDNKTYCQMLWLMAIIVDCYGRGNILIYSYFGIFKTPLEVTLHKKTRKNLI